MVENSKGIPSNIQGPDSQNTRRVENEPDPEQFRRAMRRVGKSGESEQKDKSPSKNKQTQEEANREQSPDEAGPPPPPSTLFSEYMRGDKEQGSIFDAESAGIQVQTPSHQDSPLTTPPPSSIPRGDSPNFDAGPAPPISEKERGGLTSPPSSPQSSDETSQQTSSSSAQSHGGEEPSYSQPPPPPPHETPHREQISPEEHDHSASSKAQPTQGEKERDSPSTDPPPKQQKTASKTPKKRKPLHDPSLLTSQPLSSALKAKKSVKTRGKPQKKLISVKSKSSTVGGKTPVGKEEKKASKSSRPSTKKGGNKKSPSPAGSKSSTPQKKRPSPTPRKEAPKRGKPSKLTTKGVVPRSRPKKQTVIGGAPTPPAAGSGSSSGKKRTHTHTRKPSGEGHPSAAAPLPEGLLPPITPLDSEPVYLRLPQDLFELVEKIGGTLLILHQQNCGVTQTTVTLNIPNSILDGAQVLIEEYSTAPKSFNIQLIGDPEAVELFNSHMSQLNSAFQQANYDFEVRLLNPILTERKRSPHMIRRKGAAGEDKGDGEGKNR